MMAKKVNGKVRGFLGIFNIRGNKKKDRHCYHCNMNGYVKEIGFKLHGYRDRCKEN